MADLFENPMGLDGFEFVEFAAPDPSVLEHAFTLLGFSEVARHRSKDVTLWRQGDINFIINNEDFYFHDATFPKSPFLAEFSAIFKSMAKQEFDTLGSKYRHPPID